MNQLTNAALIANDPGSANSVVTVVKA